ncbi:flagellar biosynthetic protein FliO [Novosphingobium colocasiae]|uniref:Flagellar biogenesis protein n=1 Tax=Novosphingobium colocasiae TaxID=1256513 RepID=A0A918PD86_9SPHN|nr:flagellar biosynthetic protein FliO [Novosphingobium colocasiae]GGZ00357.1 hypothetical protein GCM10011614_14250 [Novosphingobium colocasiae]
MDALSLLRMLGALLLVLGGMVCALWAVKRYDLTIPRKWLEGLGQKSPEKRLEVVERLAIDQRRSIILLRRDDTEFSILVGPDGVTVLDGGAPAPARPAQAAEPRPAPRKTAPAFAERLAMLPEVTYAQEARKADLH